MKHLIVFIFVICFSTANAQQIEIIEPSMLEVRYTKRTVTDTLQRQKDYREERDMVLRIGQHVSTFFSYRYQYMDSLCVYAPDLYFQIPAEQRNINASREKEIVFKNWPVNKVTVYNHFGLSHHTYSEDLEKPEWEICDSTEVILGFICQMATAKYRGRKWYAFFTPEIPISDGPWKLCGLPGLILKAFDEKQDYIFAATSMKANTLPDIAMCNYMNHYWEKKTRASYYKAWFKALHEDIGKSFALSGVIQIDDAERAKIVGRPLPHRNYDFEETDYIH